jgi:CDP-diacylglycerol--serine O-phosphatidyltransferase
VSAPAVKSAGRPKGIRRGAAILPSLFTTGNIFLGFWAIVRSFHGQYELAAPLIIWAGVLDMLDGRIARLTNTTSEFGAELDSIADVVSFGVAPAVLAFAWGFATLPRAGWLAAFLFVMCGAFRLARFNVQRHATDGRYFVGLPIPAAATQVAVVVMAAPEAIGEKPVALVAIAAVIGLASLMVSTFRYRSFKAIDLRSRRSYVSLLGIAVGLAVLFLHTEAVLLVVATGYVLSAPSAYLYSLARRRGGPPPVVVGDPSPRTL